jgi:DNA-directed RNA polymerase subunit N
MMIPVRCFTCGKVIGSQYEAFKERRAAGEDPTKIMDSIGLPRYCCRRMLVTQVDIIDDSAPYA